MVAFSIYKSSKYLFDCVGITDDVHAQPYPVVNVEMLEELRLNAVDVIKRIDYAEVDKLVACCRKHPPQTIVMPATHGDIAAFQEFVKYLKARRRAGVAILTDGLLLILAPVENDDLQLRCVVVNAKPSADISAALSSHVPIPCETPAQSANSMPPPLSELCEEKERDNRDRIFDRANVRNEDTDQELSYKQKQKIQDEIDKTIAAKTDLEMLYNLPKLERVTRITQLRQDYEAFHMLHYDILKEWIKADPDKP